MVEDWEATASGTGVWVDSVTKHGRGFMAAWRKEKEDPGRHRQRKEANEARRVVFVQGSVERLK